MEPEIILTDAQKADLRNRFGYHGPPTEEARDHIAANRRAFYETAKTITLLMPPGREAALAITNLEQASFWANAAIARSWGPAEPFGA